MNQAANLPSDYLDPEAQTIEQFDEELWSAMKAENQRQEEHIELIASENYASPRVLEAQGSVLTNKYAEGYPGKRYYGGCEYVDIAEQLAIERARSCLERLTRMCSPTLARARTSLFITRFCSPAIRSWE